MKSSTRRVLMVTVSCTLLLGLATLSGFAQTTDISSSPTSLTFPNTYVGLQSGAKVLTITNLTGGGLTITSIGFTCAGFGIASGIAPFSFGATQSITHYSIFFQPTVAQTYNCDFVINLNDGTYLDVPLTGTSLTCGGVASVSTSALNFPNQTVGTSSAGQNVTITNTGTTALNLTNITLAPLSFSTSAVTLPTQLHPGQNVQFSTYYTPSEVTSENGTLDLTYDCVPDNGVALTGNGVAASSLVISTPATLPQATQNAAYQTTLATSGGKGPYTWALQTGSLPSGLNLSSAGEISGTLASTVGTGNYSFTVKVTDTSNGASATSTMTIGVFANLADNCNDLSFDVPNTTTPITALTDLGTGTYQGYEGGLYPNGSNVRPPSHDADGVTFAKGIVPLDANGNYSPTGHYVMLAIGESTAQNEFNRFLPIANADPSKNPYLIIVNGAQGGATPFNFESTTSAYWDTVINNYLPQNGVTPQQVVVIWMEDTDGIASGTFPSDITQLQSEYETMMQTAHTLFPNLKMLYFSSRVYGGYSNGVGNPDNPEPYAYEVSYAVKWAIQDQLNGNANLNYNPNLGPVVAPWMSWGPYYWANGMLGRNDGLEWDCADFSSDGTHPSSSYGQLKVATELLQFLKTDDTTIPWFVAPSNTLSANGGNNQTGSAGTTLPTALTALATNGSGTAQSGVSVTFSDNHAGGSFNPVTATTNSSGLASSSYTLPSTAQTVSITATATGYNPATFIETATSSTLALPITGGNNQSGTVGTTLPVALTVEATNNGNPVSGVTVTFSTTSGGTFGTPVVTTGSNGLASTTYTLPATAGTITITASATGYPNANFTETATSNSTVTQLGLVSGGQQTGTVGTALPKPIVVRAKNSSGQIVVGASVTFSSPQGGSFNPTTAITDSSGNATTTYTVPTVPESITITATSGTAKVNIGAKSVAGPPATVKIVSGNNQSANPKTKLPKNLGVSLTDQYGNPLAGFTITFNDNGAGGTFSSTTAVTNSSGQAGVSYTTGSTPGTVKINATESSTLGVRFTETVL